MNKENEISLWLAEHQRDKKYLQLILRSINL